MLNKKRRTRHGQPADDDDEEWTVWDSCTEWRENRTLIDLLLHMYRRDIAGEQVLQNGRSSFATTTTTTDLSALMADARVHLITLCREYMDTLRCSSI